jgi:hypothetical protein
MPALRDDWDDEGGSIGPEAVSWKFASKGDAFDGIVVPPNPLTQPAKGYELKQRRGKGRDKSKKAVQGLLVWPPQSDENRGPMTEAEYARAYGDAALKEALDNFQGVPMKVITLITGYKAKEFFSGKAKDRAADNPEFVDDGLRRLFIDGPDLPSKVDAALKVVGKRGLAPGMRVQVKLVEREENKGGNEGETNRFAVMIALPTPETMALVDKYIVEAVTVAESDPIEDPWAADSSAQPGSFAGNTEDPPF